MISSKRFSSPIVRYTHSRLQYTSSRHKFHPTRSHTTTVARSGHRLTSKMEDTKASSGVISNELVRAEGALAVAKVWQRLTKIRDTAAASILKRAGEEAFGDVAFGAALVKAVDEAD
ncbi:hypothetical protein LTR53_017378 [Teratosphaeriaceae sp. CCFEE 6253]|nr:hypothetical protein LTR53_017378 [Teratosphaeriaceae sp. CCFEE 6253]